MSQDQISDADYALALAAGRDAVATEIRASSVRYTAEHDVLEIITLRHAGFLIPRLWIGALQDVPVADLAGLQVWEDGSAIELPDHDIQISVDGLLSAVLPAMLPARSIATIFAAQGGRKASTAKRGSGREIGHRSSTRHKPAVA